MINDPKKRRSPASAPHTDQAKSKNSTATLSRITREIAAIVTIGLMVGTMFWSAVFGMAANLATGPLAPVIIQADRLALASGRLGE